MTAEIGVRVSTCAAPCSAVFGVREQSRLLPFRSPSSVSLPPKVVSLRHRQDRGVEICNRQRAVQKVHRDQDAPVIDALERVECSPSCSQCRALQDEHRGRSVGFVPGEHRKRALPAPAPDEASLPRAAEIGDFAVVRSPGASVP